ncbi:nucleophile aminohydrolase [Chytridium lagenaria]|nr:nucleophile aminohydrolase [Chytridium lagenaria]
MVLPGDIDNDILASVGMRIRIAGKRRVALAWTLVLALFGISTCVYLFDVKINVVDTPTIIQAKNGAVSSENVLCSDAGVDILKEGGSAVDAMIATSLCIGVTNMYSSGIGGGGFMLLRSKTGDYEYIDFREAAPKAAFTNMYKDDPLKAQIGGLAAGVPGEIRGFEVAHKKYGKLPWKKLFDGAIRISRYGWNVTPMLAKRMKIIAAEGAAVFYEGRIAEKLVATIQKSGGILTMDDMKNYKAEVREPLFGYYHGRRIVTTPSPASGAVLLSILNILEGYNLPASGKTALNAHRLVEAMKFAYGQRSYYGDPIDPVFRNISKIEDKFSQKSYAALVRANISDARTFEPTYYSPKFDVKEDHGTMHVSVLTKDGEAASLTSTVNLIFGARIIDADTGIIINDEMDDFSIPIPLSSSVPVITENNGVVEFVGGASGGSRIITATLQVLLGVLDFNMNIGEAIAEPRLHHQLLPNQIEIENPFSEHVAAFLESKGHEVKRYPPGFTVTGVEAIHRRSNGIIEAASDARKGGISAGW